MDTKTRQFPALLAAVFALSGVFMPRQTFPVHAAPALQVLARPGGQPDDITVDFGGHLIWGNLARNTIERLQNGHIVTVARNLAVPEGLVSRPRGVLFVAAQGSDEIVRIAANGTRSVIYALSPVPGQEGVDGIGRDPRTGDLLIPDSPRGTVLRVSPNGRNARVIAQGLGRPVAAATDAHGNVLLPDEHLGTLVVVSPRGAIRHRGVLSTPDDVAVDRRGRVWVTTLGDGGLWLMTPNASPRRVLVGLANPQGLTLDRCGDPIIVEQNTGSIVRLLLTSKSHTCAL